MPTVSDHLAAMQQRRVTAAVEREETARKKAMRRVKAADRRSEAAFRYARAVIRRGDDYRSLDGEASGSPGARSAPTPPK